MVADPVGLHPALRPWHRAGVEFLLADHAVPAPYSLCSAAPAIAAGGRIGAGFARPNARAAGPVAQAGGGPRAAASAPAVGATGGTGRLATSPQIPQRDSGTGGATSPQIPQGDSGTGSATSPQIPQRDSGTGGSLPDRPVLSSRPQPAVQIPPAQQRSVGQESNQPLPYLPPDQWPAMWQQRLQKTAPAAVLWTYWALGEDMCVRPNPARRALLQKLLADLGHPAGTHSFWPAALPHSLDAAASAESTEILLYPAPEIFWSGVQHLKARAVVVMGSPAIKALELPPRLRPFQQTRHHGTLVVVLRDVDFLAQETTRYDAVKAFLRQALAPFGR